MGSNRKRPFGYKMELGEIVLHPAEAETVRWLYDSYLAGASYNALVDKLRERGISYDGDKPWNKNMAARILADSRYTGEGGFRPSSRRPGSTWFRLKGKKNSPLQKTLSPEGTAETVRRQPTGMGGAAGVGPPEPTDPASGAYHLSGPGGWIAAGDRESAPGAGRAPAPPAGG
ncbi:recombinase family protein [Flavonifractor plautii]|nr:recombinase family protein [Flavonifractor plautii]